MQTFCVSQIPENSQYGDLSAAFLCGKNIADPWKREIFQKTGLIHLLVVSGGHFAFLVDCLGFISFPLQRFSMLRSFILWSVLFLFSLLTGFQAPVVRALLTLIFKNLSDYFLWQWDPGKTQLAAGLIILSLYPEWIYSLSFYLSWLTSLSLCFPLLWHDHSNAGKSSYLRKFYQWLSTCFCVQTVVALFFWSFSSLSVAMNILVAPFLMLILWPLCLSALIFSPLVSVTDFLWKWILWGLAYLSKDFSSSDIRPESLHWLYLWSLIVGLHLGAEILRRLRFRGAYA